MNAYELADQLDNVKYQNGAKPFEMYANMLRQQADRIAELEKENTDLVFRAVYAEKTMHMIERHYDQLEAQTKPLSDEVIHELANEHLRTQNQDGHLVVLGMEDFARAIEESHGIK